jgi:4-hydroxybenzoate polyprenyltransferase
MKKLVDLLLFGAIFIAGCSTALCFETNLLLGFHPQNPAVYIFIFGATLIQYNLHYLFKHPAIPNTRRSEWLARNRTIQKSLIAMGGFLVVISIYQLQPRHFYWLFFLALLALLYSLPILPLSKKSLKEYGMLKIFLLTLVWTLVTVWFPIEQQSPAIQQIGIIFLQRFVFMFVLCLAFDIRDMSTDQQTGIQTIPVRTGKKIAYFLIDISLVLFVLISLLQYLQTGRRYIFFAFIVSALCTKFFINRSKTSASEYLYLAGIDGMMLLQVLLLTIGTIQALSLT